MDFVQASLRAESRGTIQRCLNLKHFIYTHNNGCVVAEMECCGDLQLVSNGGVALCHPYALGRYRKIGVCGGRSFYQHSNNSDIFLYHACAAWYVGLEASYILFKLHYNIMISLVTFLHRLVPAAAGCWPSRWTSAPPARITRLRGSTTTTATWRGTTPSTSLSSATSTSNPP